MDLGGDVRSNPKLSGTRHNVFGIQTGVAISFLVKRHKAQGCRIFYVRRPEFETREDKMAFLGSTELSQLELEEIRPDGKHNWVNLTQNDFESLMPLSRPSGQGCEESQPGERPYLNCSRLGWLRIGDEWVYGESSEDV